MGRLLLHVSAATALAAFASAFGDDLPHSPYTDIAVATVDLLGLLLLGWYARWSSLLIFTVALVWVTVLHEELFWTGDPRLQGIDDLGPTALLLALPLAWVVLALGALARRVAASVRNDQEPERDEALDRRAGLVP